MSAPAHPPGTARVDVTTYPSSSTTRLLILLLAILASALFAGGWLHNTLRGSAWVATVQRCSVVRPSTGDLASVLAAQETFQTCMADAERTRGWFGIAVAGCVGLIGLAIVVAAPRVVERRRGLRAVDERYAAATSRLAALAGEAGLARPPRALVGRMTQRDAFSYGVPGRYRIGLPKAVAIRAPGGSFDAVTRHELQHIAHRDVPLAWLARAGGYALAVVFGVPVVISLARRDVSLLPDFAWRAAVLAMGLVLARAAWLRSREHDADLRAAHAAGTPAGLLAVLEPLAGREPDAVRPGAGQPGRVGDAFRRVLANHPKAADRVAALREPQRAASTSAVEGFTVGFFTAISLSLVHQALFPLFSGIGHPSWGYAVAAGLLGPFVGATLGLGLWRESLLTRVGGRPTHVGRMCAAIFTGTVLGQVTSLAAAGTGSLTREEYVRSALLVAVAMTGATVLAAGLGELWADTAPALPRAAAAWVPAVLLPGALFTATLWSGVMLQQAIALGGWALASSLTVTVLAQVPLAAALLLLAAAASWAVHRGRRTATAPAWLTETVPPQAAEGLRWRPAGVGDLRPVLAVGAGAGLAGGAVAVLHRILSPPLSDVAAKERYYYTTLVVAALTAAAVGVALAVLVPRRGPGLAPVAVTVSVLTTEMCFVVLNTVRGGALTVPFLANVGRQMLALSLLLLLVACPLAAAVPGRSAGQQRTTTARAPAIAAVAVGCLAAVLSFAARGFLVPRFELEAAVGRISTPGLPQTADQRSAAIEIYVQAQAPVLNRGYAQIVDSVDQVRQNTRLSGTQRAELVQRSVLPMVDDLTSRAERTRTGVPELDAAHEHLLASLRAVRRGFAAEVEFYRSADPDALRQALADQSTAVAEYRQWQSLITAFPVG